MTKLRNTFLSMGLALATTFAIVQPAQADSTTTRVSEDLGIVSSPITAPMTKIKYERPSISSTPAPVEEAPVVAVQYSQPEATTTETSQAPVAKKNASTTPPTVQAPVETPAPVIETPSGVGAGILASAYAQIGINQDCTAMVERALSSVGIHTGDIAPLDFLRYGVIVSNPQPGDLMVTAGHVAVYAGNGMAISGGFNGNQTVLHPASYLAGSVYVRV